MTIDPKINLAFVDIPGDVQGYSLLDRLARADALIFLFDGPALMAASREIGSFKRLYRPDPQSE